MDFFMPGITYMWRRDGYKAPEQWLYFTCVSAAELPGSQDRIAFGFITTGSLTNRWTPTGLGDTDWANGWIVWSDEPQS
ncbi:hypothetical protein [Streptomyces sp. NPDC094049]|uniref:hypothetical protein n=1 Tax=Streptomyces sp. NPDC094049 TaxID=3154987 RepID=UPI0033314B58